MRHARRVVPLRHYWPIALYALCLLVAAGLVGFAILISPGSFWP